MTAFTIGHSARTDSEFIELLRENGIRLLVDVRRHPGSRHQPQFNRETLAASLEAAGIAYRHALELGGRRQSRRDSPNTAWRNSGFRGYADWMSTPEFRDGLARLISEVETRATAVMCAEAVPWRCHRFLLSDALVARGIDVVHVLGSASTQPHTLNRLAKVSADGSIVYKADDAQTGLL